MNRITMKTFLNLILILFTISSFSQKINFETEKKIIRETLSQYLDTSPNSVASYIKGKKGYDMLQFAYKMGVAMEEDSIKKQELIYVLDSLDYISNNISAELKNRKIQVKISDTLYAYQYKPLNNDLRKNIDWENNYQYLLDDFKYKNMARLDTIIGEEYIDLIKRQIHYKGTYKLFSVKELDQSYYEFTTENDSCNDEYCFKAGKVYRAVFNDSFTKGCYLFSFICSDNQICRSFIFIRKEQNQWIYVDEYPSWIVDES